MGLSHKGFAESDDFGESARAGENLGMSCHPDDAAQHLRRGTVPRVAVDDSVQPISTKIVVARVGSESMNEDVDIRENHGSSIRSCRSLDRFRSTPGNVPPDALEIGSCTRVRLAALDSASMVFKPSSISEVRVRPCSAAFFLALCSRSSESRIVVLICQRIRRWHRYVNEIGADT